ncbi:MAG TPA: META domain-containing protein [Candidatus Krumholzibacteria bacterium]|nr:META domain-containing protein [Candidatus Krumholzibacteria bacterium]
MTNRLAAVLWVCAVALTAGCDTKEESATKEQQSDIPQLTPDATKFTSPVGFVWKWEATQTPVERIVPPDPTRYTLEFLPDTTVTAQIDCNRGHGKYTLDGPSITIGPLATTRMACPPGSLDAVFAKQLEAARILFFRGDTLYMDLYADSGTMQFSQMPEPPKN